jgi:hypothetical protein
MQPYQLIDSLQGYMVVVLSLHSFGKQKTMDRLRLSSIVLRSLKAAIRTSWPLFPLFACLRLFRSFSPSRSIFCLPVFGYPCSPLQSLPGKANTQGSPICLASL